MHETANTSIMTHSLDAKKLARESLRRPEPTTGMCSSSLELRLPEGSSEVGTWGPRCIL